MNCSSLMAGGPRVFLLVNGPKITARICKALPVAVFGEINIINVQAGVEASEPVTVLDNFYTAPGDLHAAPGSGAPTLADAAPKESNVL